jgi:hypothetical protein
MFSSCVSRRPSRLVVANAVDVDSYYLITTINFELITAKMIRPLRGMTRHEMSDSGQAV